VNCIVFSNDNLWYMQMAKLGLRRHWGNSCRRGTRLAQTLGIARNGSFLRI